ncbi:Imm57 family immunity protein, partial [Escherichia coli]|nr:Imm57 family immunity protein [Escherichia coli]
MARLLTIVLFFSISANAVTVNQFQRELDLADKAILWALISASTQEGRKACSLSYFSCKAAEAELGLAYMAANDNKAFLTSLSREGANKRGNSSRLTQSFHFFMFEPI